MGAPSLPAVILGLLPALRLRQPRRHMLRLDCILQQDKQVLSQVVQVHLISHINSELGQHLLGVIFAAVEATVNEILDSPSQRVEQGYNRQRGGNDSELRSLTGKRPEEQLLQHRAPKINERQGTSEKTIL